MEIVDQPLILNFVGPDNVPHAASIRVADTVGYDEWLEWMMKDTPHVIFFYTIATTDIFEREEPEINFNTVAIHDGYGGVHHTYAPECPPGCYGQLEGCSYKQPPYTGPELDLDYPAPKRPPTTPYPGKP